MDTSTARILNSANARFYRDNAASFSSTRHGSWRGWDRALELLGVERAPASVADVACGNLRFEAYLAQRFPSSPIRATCVDNCAPLAQLAELPPEVEVRFKEHDLIVSLLAGQPLHLPPAELVACAGFMHHIPGHANRVKFLEELFASALPGGCVMVSFWQFLEDEGLARKAQQSTAEGLESLQLDASQLEEGDCLLGWQDVPEALRYCHSFTYSEVQRLAREASESSNRDAELQLFECDGRNGRLNCWLLARMC